MGRLTTHVLDTARGRPAAGLRVDLHGGAGGAAPQGVLASARTGADGRCAAPLLEGARFQAGVYELAFHVGAYFRESGAAPTDPPFLDVVAIRFGVASADEHYHVPLLVSPFGYTTYRGS